MRKSIVVAAAVITAGCSTQQNETQTKVGMPNPASEYCIKIGGVLNIVDGPNGQVGICELPDGTKIEEWELFRRDN